MKTPGKRVDPDADSQLLLKEGEYGKRTDDTRVPGGVWYVRPPGCHMGSLAGHKVEEHEDGTISVSPSILINYRDATGQPGFEGWHGYLKRGVFEKC